MNRIQKMSSIKPDVTIKTTITSQAMGGSSTDTMVLYAPFLNLFGIFMTVALCVSFLLLSGLTLKFMKVFSFKVRVIIDKAHNSDDTKLTLMKQDSRITEYEQKISDHLETLSKVTFKSIFKQLSWKYNFFTFYYPIYRANWKLRPQVISIQPDLLRPTLQFHVLQLLTSGFVAWIQSVFFTTLLQATYRQPVITDKEESSLLGLAREFRPDNQEEAMAGLTLCAVIFSTIVNMVIMHKVYARVYMQCIRIAFLTERSQRRYTAMPEGRLVVNENEYNEFIKAIDQIPDREGDGKKFLAAHLFQQKRNNQIDIQKVHPVILPTQADGPQQSSRIDMTTQAIDSTRQLIVNQDDSDRTPRESIPRAESAITQENIRTDFDKPDPVFEDQDRLLFLEDLHHPGDSDLLQNEALISANQTLVTNFTLLFLVFTLFSAISCFLNYKLEQQQSLNAFIMFCSSFLGDHFFLRPILLSILAFVRLVLQNHQNQQSSRTNEQSSRKDLLASTTNLENLALNDDEESSQKLKITKDTLKQLKQKPEFEQIQRLNMMLIQKVKEAYGDRGIKVLEKFRGEDQKVLRKHYLETVFNPIYDYSKEKMLFSHQLRAGASVSSENRTQPVAEKVKLNPKDAAVHHSLIPGRTNKALGDLNKYKPILKEAKPLQQYTTFNKDKKSYFESIRYHQSMDQSYRTDKEDSVIKKRSLNGSQNKSYASLHFKPDHHETIFEMTQDRKDSQDFLSEEYRMLEDLEVKIFEIGNSCDENGMSSSQKGKITQLRLQRAKIKRLAAQRKAQKEQIDAEAQKRLEEMNEEMEQFELEQLASNLEKLSNEQINRLNELRLKKLNKLKTMINQKNPVNLSYDDALQLKELIDNFKIPLSALEQHRLQEQLKRHNLFSKRDYDMIKLQEYRYKLKATGPSAQFELKDAQKLGSLLEKYQIELPEEEWIAWRDIQRKLGLLSKEELQVDMIAQLRAQLKDPNYRTTFQKVYLNRLIHLLDKVPVQLTPEEQERLLDIKVKFNVLSTQDKQLLEFRKLQQKLINNQPLTKKEQSKYIAGQQIFSNQSNLRPEQVQLLAQALQNYPLLDPSQNTSLPPSAISRHQQQPGQLNQSLALQSEQSAAVQDDPVVFRTLDELMASKKRKMLEGSIAEDEGAIEYSKDDMTQYSKAVGIVNKKRVKGKKKGKKKKGKKKVQPRGPGAVHYDVDADRDETGTIENNEGSLEESVDLSLEEQEAAEENQPRKSLFELQVQRRASSKAPTPTNIISDNIKGRLETLQEIYTQDLKKEFSPGVRLSYQNSTVKEPSPLNRQQTIGQSLAPSFERSQAPASFLGSGLKQQPIQRHSADTSVNQPPKSQETQALVNFESDSYEGKEIAMNGAGEVNAAKTQMKNVSEFMHDSTQEENRDEENQIYHMRGTQPLGPGTVPLISSGKMSAASAQETSHLVNSWARRPAGYYRELSLKQITEAMASGGSSRSSIGAGKNAVQASSLIPRDLGSFGGSRETRAKSQERSNRYGVAEQRRKRMQTLAGDINRPPASESPIRRLDQKNARKIQSSADLHRPQQSNFILQQDNLVKSSKDEEEYYDEADTQYNKDDKMQRVKIKKKRVAGRKIQRDNYESPYQEYLLGAIREGEGSQKKGEIHHRQSSNPQSNVKFKQIKSIYYEGDQHPRAGRAQSPITSARLMIHPVRNSQTEFKNQMAQGLPEATFGGRHQDIESSPDDLQNRKQMNKTIGNPFYIQSQESPE